MKNLVAKVKFSRQFLDTFSISIQFIKEKKMSSSIISLNEDCLLTIFRHLNVCDLVSVSQVCQLFKYVAVDAFKYECKDKPIQLSNDSKESKLEATTILRNFGQYLRKVQIEFGKCGNEKLFNLVVDQCSSQLIEVEFSNSCINPIEKTFLTKATLSRFNAKFKNLKALRFDGNVEEIAEPDCIEQPFPVLEELSLTHEPFYNGNVYEFIELNPQVKRLFTLHRTNLMGASKLIESVDRRLPHLEAFGLWMNGLLFTTRDQRRFLKNVRCLRLGSTVDEENLQYLPISYENVTDLELKVTCCSDSLFSFISQHKHLEKVTIRSRPILYRMLSELRNNLPNTQIQVIY